METINLGSCGLPASALGLGCMRMGSLDAKEAAAVLTACVENGITFFDHADIYGGGKSEEAFAAGLYEAGISRDRILVQSKCGIRQGQYDFSKEHLVKSVEGILRRLKTEYLDVLALHRPDALVEPEEVAEVFDALHRSGKVRYFGVSNHHAMQLELLSKYLHQRLIVNQLQFSPAHTGLIDCGMHVNMKTSASVQHDGMLLDYCRLNNVTIQAWSPFQYGMIEGPFFDNPDFAGLTKVIRRIAAEHSVSDSACVVAWILRHPARIQVLAGSMSPSRIADMAKAESTTLSREEWYEIYRAGGNMLP